ncbi:MAG: two-component regulator propeller domain-containing protein [Saprospiraceae bacterium]
MKAKLLICLFILIGTILSGQEAQIGNVRRYGGEEGLSQSFINCLHRDKTGFVWVGTQDGLNRFDGHSFQPFFHDPGDTLSLSNNYIWCLLEDSRQSLWVGTFGGGLCRFDPATETFRAYHPAPPGSSTLSENSIRSLFEYPAGVLWVGADAGLWRLDTGTGEFMLIAGLKNVCSIAFFRQGRLLIGAKEGLFFLDTRTRRLTPVFAEGVQLPPVNSILPDAMGACWAGTLDGLFRFGFSTRGDSLIYTGHLSAATGQLPSNLVNVLYCTGGDSPQGAGETVWAGTFDGLVRINAALETERILPEGKELPSQNIHCLLELQPGLIWAGTREGIGGFSWLPPLFSVLEQSEGLCDNSVLGIREDGKGNLWIATRKGLTRVGADSTECLSPETSPSMPYEYVINLFSVNPDSSLVVFRRKGMAWLYKDKATDSWLFSRIQDFEGLLGDAGILTVIPEGDEGVFWLGTPGLGLIRWDSRKGRFKAYTTQLPHPYIFCLLEDSKKRLWIGTANGGLCLMDRETEAFTCYTSAQEGAAGLTGNMVLSLFEDSRGRLWICTANGLNLWKGGGLFRQFTQKDGLPNNVVYGMLEDRQGYLWISTNRGLSKIDFDGKDFKVVQYHVSNGLPGEEFNQYASYQAKDGRMYFGGIGGLVFFHPESIKPYPVAPKVALTALRLFNRPLKVGRDSEGYALPAALPFLEQIVLPHDQNFLEFQISALGFFQPEKNQYAYKMEGVDEDWVYCGARRFASYPNLPPGRYRFLAKAANHDGVWCEAPAMIDIWIKQPWWRRWWAWLLYSLLISSLVWALIRWRMAMVRKVERVKIAEREAIRKRVAQDFHDEAGNRITRLALLAELVRRNADMPGRLGSLVDQMEENVQELRKGMRDFIWTIDPEKDNLFETVVRIKDFAHGLFVISETGFHGPEPEEALRQVVLTGQQRRHCMMLFKEAISNCLQYAGAQNAWLTAVVEEGRVVVEFGDNGKGFDPGEAEQGNGLKNMKSRAEKTGAELVIFSKPGHGTTIRLAYPIPANHPKGG